MTGDTLSTENVDQVVQDAGKKYFDIRMLVDAMFWQAALRLLQEKHGFKLAKTVTKPSRSRVTTGRKDGSGNREVGKQE